MKELKISIGKSIIKGDTKLVVWGFKKPNIMYPLAYIRQSKHCKKKEWEAIKKYFQK